MERHAIHVLNLGDSGLRYVFEELETAGRDFGGPLAKRLSELRLGAPFSFLTAEASPQTHSFRQGGTDDGSADQWLATAISEWLMQVTAGATRRLLLFEDPLARRSDAATRVGTRHFGERVYFAGVSGDSPSRIELLFGQLAGYPGVGVLSELPAEQVDSAEMTDCTMKSLVAAASAVLVRAWDDEAFVVSPVGERLAPADLRLDFSRPLDPS